MKKESEEVEEKWEADEREKEKMNNEETEDE
jgi:hypothetical protein